MTRKSGKHLRTTYESTDDHDPSEGHVFLKKKIYIYFLDLEVTIFTW